MISLSEGEVKLLEAHKNGIIKIIDEELESLEKRRHFDQINARTDILNKVKNRIQKEHSME